MYRTFKFDELTNINHESDFCHCVWETSNKYLPNSPNKKGVA